MQGHEPVGLTWLGQGRVAAVGPAEHNLAGAVRKLTSVTPGPSETSCLTDTPSLPSQPGRDQVSARIVGFGRHRGLDDRTDRAVKGGREQ